LLSTILAISVIEYFLAGVSIVRIAPVSENKDNRKGPEKYHHR
jgi:hypothetical protein